MGSAAGLFVEGFDGDYADVAVDDGGRDLEGSEKIGAGMELGLGKIAGVEGMGPCKYGVDFGLQFGADGRGEPFPLEVDAGVGDFDLGSGDPGAVVAQGDGVEHVEHGVVAGQGLAACGVQAEGDGEAGGEFRVGQDVPEDSFGIGLDEGDRQDGAAREGERSVVAGLTASAGVEAGLVESDGVFADG